LESSERELRNEMVYRKTLESEFENEVLHDSLTGIYNKRASEKVLSEKLKLFKKENRIASLVFIDLDDLKTINDNEGHDEGDKYLISFTEIVSDYLNNCKYLFRVGGDEFIIFFEDMTYNESNKIIKKITDICLLKNIRFSYGISFFDSNKDLDLYTIIKEADIKMYNQKRRKKQQFRKYLRV
jgi:diguanylate cyclase (GGDEF)-like protein